MWTEENMSRAIKEVTDGKLSCFKASKVYNLPLSTLKYKIKKYKDGLSVEEATKKQFGKTKLVFTEDQEKELVDCILFMENSLYGVSLADIRRFAYEMADRFHIVHNFDKEEKMASKDWLQGFLKRQQTYLPQLYLLQKSETS